MNNNPAPAGYTPIEPPKPAKDPAAVSSVLKTAVIVILVLLLIGAGLGAFYFYSEYSLLSSEVDAKVDAAVLDAVKAREDELEAEFAEREKSPSSTFTGPSDYGSLSFKYPRTWSVYIAKDASSGGNFEAYLHPGEVSPVSGGTIFALRVTIESNTNFENVANRYNRLVENGELKSSVITVNGSDSATRFDGTLPNKLVGSVVIFRIRDKVVTLESDAEIYRADFDSLLKTITFSN
ncbi:hypothetical protein IJ095_02995 [Candidatus Saccharibacteria bacterium]|nr:hypothetical protein [Candidatus Saccharibacteria bacterium]